MLHQMLASMYERTNWPSIRQVAVSIALMAPFGLIIIPPNAPARAQSRLSLHSRMHHRTFELVSLAAHNSSR